MSKSSGILNRRSRAWKVQETVEGVQEFPPQGLELLITSYLFYLLHKIQFKRTTADGKMADEAKLPPARDI